MSLDQTPITRTYGHGGITLTAYPSSGRVGVEVAAENAVMDYSDLLDFADLIHKPRTVTTAAELDALPVGSVVLALADGHHMMGDHDARFKWPHAYESFDDEPGFWYSVIDGDGFESSSFFYEGAPILTVLHEGGAA